MTNVSPEIPLLQGLDSTLAGLPIVVVAKQGVEKPRLVAAFSCYHEAVTWAHRETRLNGGTDYAVGRRS